jgi:protein-S-isoprenylcysteine O-methyltransferase Ste14
MLDALTAWLYRHRGATAVPFVALLLMDANPTPNRWLLGLPLVAAGELLRLWAAGHIGDHSRGRTMRSPRLVTSGPYARMRHPLYVGNALATAGLLVVGRAFEPGLALGFGAAFLTQYALFIRREEALQADAAPAEWADYAARVPAVGWAARVARSAGGGAVDWRRALRLEWPTLRTILALLAALLVLGAIRRGE